MNLSGGNVQPLEGILGGTGFASMTNNPLVGSPHDGFTGNWRQSVLFDSIQINTNASTGRIQIDIDPFNPAAPGIQSLFGLPAHFFGQVLPNFVLQVDTNYSSVANTLQQRGIKVFNCQ